MKSIRVFGLYFPAKTIVQVQVANNKININVRTQV